MLFDLGSKAGADSSESDLSSFCVGIWDVNGVSFTNSSFGDGGISLSDVRVLRVFIVAVERVLWFVFFSLRLIRRHRWALFAFCCGIARWISSCGGSHSGFV